jgi:hypothetical protein
MVLVMSNPDSGPGPLRQAHTGGNQWRHHASMPSSMRSPKFNSMLESRRAPAGGLRAAAGSGLGLGLGSGLGLAAALGIALSIAAVPTRSFAAEPPHCLSGDEQRAAIVNGKTVPIATVIHSLHRAPKDVIKAQLCQEPDRLIYKLTLLGRDGKVKRETVDATSGAVVGER